MKRDWKGLLGWTKNCLAPQKVKVGRLPKHIGKTNKKTTQVAAEQVRGMNSRDARPWFESSSF